MVRSSWRWSSWTPARDAHGPSPVPEVALQLSGDRRRRERREAQTAVRIEPLDRLEQADERDLAEVVERLAAVREPSGEELREAHVLLDELVAQRPFTGPAVLDELRRGSRPRRARRSPGHRARTSRFLATRNGDLFVVLVQGHSIGQREDQSFGELVEPERPGPPDRRRADPTGHDTRSSTVRVRTTKWSVALMSTWHSSSTASRKSSVSSQSSCARPPRRRRRAGLRGGTKSTAGRRDGARHPPTSGWRLPRRLLPLHPFRSTRSRPGYPITRGHKPPAAALGGVRLHASGYPRDR